MTETNVKSKPVTLVPINEVHPTRKSELAQNVAAMIQVMGEDAQPHTRREYEIMKDLVTHWLDLKAKTAKERIDATLLPDLYVEMVEANIPREAITGEKWRNKASSAATAISGAFWGLFFGALQGMEGAMVAGLERAPFVLGAGMAAFLISFVYRAFNASQTGQPLTGQLMGNLLSWSVLWGGAATFAALLAVAAYRAIERHNKRQEKKERERLLGPAEMTGESNA